MYSILVILSLSLSLYAYVVLYVQVSELFEAIEDALLQLIDVIIVQQPSLMVRVLFSPLVLVVVVS